MSEIDLDTKYDDSEETESHTTKSLVYTQKDSQFVTLEEYQLNEQEELLFERLRTWRNKLAGLSNLAPYCIATNIQLKELTVKCPRNYEQLREIKGFIFRSHLFFEYDNEYRFTAYVYD